MLVSCFKDWRRGCLDLTLGIGFEIASLPTTTVQMKKDLLNFAVVGGGRE